MLNLKSKRETSRSPSQEKQDDPQPLDNDESTRPRGLKLVLIFLSLVLTTFLVALDTTILATAIPTITSQFNSLGDVSWYNSGFLLTTCAFQLPYGRAYKLLDTKWTFLSAIIIFEIGSAVSGSTPTSIGLIIGRAIQGIGGMFLVNQLYVVQQKLTTLQVLVSLEAASSSSPKWSLWRKDLFSMVSSVAHSASHLSQVRFSAALSQLM